MKNYWMIGVAALVLAACGSDSTPDPDPVDPPVVPQTTAVGTPVGSPVTQTVGTAGGSLTSADGSLRIDIPAGALTQDQTVGIQEISNEAHGKVGRAFRLTPEGTTFAQPVTITFRYTDADVEGSVPELLRVAYQDKQSYWRVYKHVTLDTAAKTVSVQSSHFSDWSLILGAQILPHTARVKVGQGAEFKVVHCDQVEVTDDTSEAVLVSILAECESNVLTSLSAQSWAVNGKVGGSSGTGIITPNSDRTLGTAVYTAPGQKPSPNPVSVSVDYTPPFETGKQVLVASVTVVDPSSVCSALKDVAAWNATFGMVYDFNGQNSDGKELTISHSADLSARLEKSSETAGGVTWIGPVTGLVQVSDKEVTPGDPPGTTALSGTDSPYNDPSILNGSRVYLNINLTTCEYNVGMVAMVPAVQTITPGDQTTSGNFPVGTVRVDWRPIINGSNLTESGDFYVHSEDWGLDNGGDAYFPSSLAAALFYENFAAEGAAGKATVAWSYQPAP